jgi:hypothetical protein
MGYASHHDVGGVAVEAVAVTNADGVTRLSAVRPLFRS